jgi:hypothetical protein
VHGLSQLNYLKRLVLNINRGWDSIRLHRSNAIGREEDNLGSLGLAPRPISKTAKRGGRLAQETVPFTDDSNNINIFKGIILKTWEAVNSTASGKNGQAHVPLYACQQE